jgi:arylsulfatase A-like enzyme
MRGEKVIQRVMPDDQQALVEMYTKEAVEFIAANKERPFFLYLPHSAVHFPIYPGKKWAGRSPHGIYSDWVEEVDWSVGEVLDALRKHDLAERTLVLFVSDNGPHREGGADPVFFKSAGGLRGMKRDLYEGGIRVPMIARWTGTVPAGRVSDHVFAHWDLLPTLADLAGAPAPPGLDGLSMARALRGEPEASQEFLYWEFHERGFQQAARMGRWKAVRLGAGAPLELYDLEADPGEEREIAAAHPDVVKKMEAYLRTARTPSERWPAGATASDGPRRSP